MKSGDIIPLKNDPRGHQYVSVMAIIEGYVMARYNNCMPFCLPLKIFERKFVSTNTGTTESYSQALQQ